MVNLRGLRRKKALINPTIVTFLVLRVRRIIVHPHLLKPGLLFQRFGLLSTATSNHVPAATPQILGFSSVASLRKTLRLNFISLVMTT